MSDQVGRAGRYIRQPAGYRAFFPNPLPPDPPLDYSILALILAEASEAVGRLDGLATLLPDPERFNAMYVRREAELSSRIEGTESTLDDILEYEAEPSSSRLPADVSEVFNYVRAMNHGIQRLDTLPLSNPLIREMHAILMEGVRGQERQPGEFRASQNWIGRPGAALAEASFIPRRHPKCRRPWKISNDSSMSRETSRRSCMLDSCTRSSRSSTRFWTEMAGLDAC